MKKSDFDKRICDVEPNADNTETYREFLINSIRYIYGDDVQSVGVKQTRNIHIVHIAVQG